MERQEQGVKTPADEQAVDKPSKKKLAGKRETAQSSLNAVLDKNRTGLSNIHGSQKQATRRQDGETGEADKCAGVSC